MNKILVLLAAVVTSALPSTPLLAQTATPTPSVAPAPTPAVDGSGQIPAAHKGKNALRDLPAADRQKLRQARKAAMADPAVQAAKASGDKKAAHRAMRDAMLRNDPSIAPALDKIRAETRGGRGEKRAGKASTSGVRGGNESEQQLTFLPADERTKLVAASRTAQGDPQVAALRQQWTGAITPETKAQAGKAYRQGLRDAMLRNDPSLAPVIQKVQEHRQAQADDMNF